MGCHCRFGSKCGFCANRDHERSMDSAYRAEEARLDEEITLMELRLAVQKASTVQERVIAKRAYLNKLRLVVK